jgi:hypothetical protein
MPQILLSSNLRGSYEVIVEKIRIAGTASIKPSNEKTYSLVSSDSIKIVSPAFISRAAKLPKPIITKKIKIRD